MLTEKYSDTQSKNMKQEKNKMRAITQVKLHSCNANLRTTLKNVAYPAPFLHKTF